MIDFVSKERLCVKHMKEFIKKENLQKRKDLKVATLLGICSKCKKIRIVNYIEGEI